MEPRVLSVNVGGGAAAGWAGRLGRTAIDKRPVQGAVPARRLGLDGDEQADTRRHGGPQKALYVYAREDLDWWERQLGRELGNGVFGENLTLRGVDVNGARLGERWRIGNVTVEVTSPRVPCATFGSWMKEERWVRRFTQAHRPGAYLSVIAEGEIAAGAAVEIVQRPDTGGTIAESFRAHHGGR